MTTRMRHKIEKNYLNSLRKVVGDWVAGYSIPTPPTGAKKLYFRVEIKAALQKSILRHITK